MAIGGTKVVQVTNIAPQATKDQMQTLFGYLGKIEDIRLYPTIRDVSCPVQSRICYIKFMDSITVGVAQHMTNTVFIDRALIVIPVQNGEIPDEYFALEMTKNGTIVPGLCPAEPNLPPNVVNSIGMLGAEQFIVTADPKLEMNGLPAYPPLPISFDSHKIEEIRRTVLVVNLDSAITSDDITEFFTPIGEVKYLRQCIRHADNSVHMLVEFSDQHSVIEALKANGKEFRGKPIKIVHSTQAIVKPQAKSNEAAQREIEEAMSRVKEAQNLISATIDPVIGMLSKDKRGSRRSRSRSRGRRRRSRSRSRRRSRSRNRSRRSRSRSKRSRSKDRKNRSKSQRRSRSGSRRSRSRRSTSRSSRSRKSRSKSRTRRDKEPRKSKEKEPKTRDKSRDREKRHKDKPRDDRRKSRDRDRSRERKDKDRDSKEKKSDKENSIDVEDKRSEKKRSRSRSRYRSRSRDRKRSRSRDRKRSRSRGSRRRSPSPRPSRRRSRSRSKDTDKKRDRKEKKEKKERSPSTSKIPRNYDEEEKGFDEKYKRKDVERDSYPESEQLNDKESSEKSDNMDISNSP